MGKNEKQGNELVGRGRCVPRCVLEQERDYRLQVISCTVV